MIGRTIGRYHILEPLGRGGMATVWKATDQLLGRTVAIKILDESIASVPASRRRFQREGEIAAQLEHPNIVPVYDAGESDGVSYLVMKLIEGETLLQFVGRRLQPIQEILRIGTSIAGALGYAHTQGVTHRDVSPRNIMLTNAGDVYVLDFGLARVADRSKSTTGNIVGTLAYLSPEALNGRETDARSDLYSLGVVLYEALTGSPPFYGEREETLGYAILNAAVEPPSRLRPEIQAELDGVMLSMLERDPTQRLKDARELIAAFDRLRGSAKSASRGDEEPSRGDEEPKRPPPEPSADAASEQPASVDRRRTRTYLAVLPVETPPDVDNETRQMLDGLTGAVRARFAGMERLHVVAAGPPEPGENDRNYSRRVGANLILRSSARFSGTTVRVTFAFVDPENDFQIAGDVVDGPRFQPFDLEDGLVAAMRRAIGIKAGVDEPPRIRTRDPAAAEHFKQALSYLRRYDHEPSIDSAVALLGGLIDSEGESAPLQATLARACLRKYRATKQRVWESRASQACQRAAALDPTSPDVLLSMGELHQAAGRNDEALSVLDRTIALQPDCYEAHIARARALNGANRGDEAEQACRLAIALRPDDWGAYSVLAMILFRRGRYAEAVEHWQRVAELTPDNALVHWSMGGALFRLGRIDEALAAYGRANQIHPDAEGFWNLGAALFSLGRYAESESAFEKAVALNPSDAIAWGNLGNALLRIPGREERMREALERAIALMKDQLDRGPGEAKHWARLAGWQVNLGCREEAEQAVRHALAMARDDVQVMVLAGKVLLRLGDRAEAKDCLRRAIENGYSVEELRRSPELHALDGDAEFECVLERGARSEGGSGNSSKPGRP